MGMIIYDALERKKTNSNQREFTVETHPTLRVKASLNSEGATTLSVLSS